MGRYWWEMALLVTFRRHESVILTWKRQMWYTGSDRYRKAWNMQIAAGTGRDTAGFMRFASLRHLSPSYSAKNHGARCGDPLGKWRPANIKGNIEVPSKTEKELH